jgi:hypothetical protein
MDICQRPEDSGSSIIRNTSLTGLANTLFFHIIESSFRIWKNNLNFLSGNHFKKSEKIKN